MPHERQIPSGNRIDTSVGNRIRFHEGPNPGTTAGRSVTALGTAGRVLLLALLWRKFRRLGDPHQDPWLRPAVFAEDECPGHVFGEILEPRFHHGGAGLPGRALCRRIQSSPTGCTESVARSYW